MSLTLGSAYSFGLTFRNPTTLVATDPSSIRFLLREEIDGTELEWIYNSSPVSGTHYPVGMNPITRSGTGAYALSYVTRKPERHSGVWVGFGTVYYTEQQTVLVRHLEVSALDPRSS